MTRSPMRQAVLTSCIALCSIFRLASGQVGHSPDASPYHDVRGGTMFGAMGGYLSGTRGVVGVGPSQGNVWSIRVERTLTRVLGAQLTVGQASTSRFVIDPTKDSLTRTTGPVTDRLALATLGLYAVLTGGKTWHGFAPYIGVEAGVGIANKVPSDTSTYNFGTKAVLGPSAGLRWFLGRRLSIRGDAKVVIWKLSYPLQYKTPSPIDGSRVLAVNANNTEWTRHGWFSAGIAWTF